ncbi:MAG TPA: sigma-70 family RNA polymerase sigma factor [Planctomycetota bacterium]
MTNEPSTSVPSLVQETAWIHRLARRLVRDEHLAADVAQDALVVGLHGSAPDDPAVTPRGWLAGIARTLAVQALRRRREREIRELLAARVGTEDVEQRSAERLRVHEVLARAVRELPEPYRTAVTLRFFEGHSPAAIARTRGHTPEAVRQHVHRGLGMLRKTLDGEFGDRRAWVLAFVSLGLDRPRGPALPVAPTSLAALVVLAALAVVVAVAWLQRSPEAPEAAPPAIVVHDESAWMTHGSGEAPRAVPGAQEPAAVVAAAERYLSQLTAMDAFAGSVLLARGGEILLHKAYGLADRAERIANTADTRFKLMSTSKSVTAVAVMRLVQAGKVDLEERVGQYVKPWPEAWRDVTVHDLLDHTSGIPNLEVEWSILERRDNRRGLAAWPAMAEGLAANPRPREPAAARYSNFNFELAGLVAESVSGMPLGKLLADLVFTPVGMKATAIDDGARGPRLAIGYFLGADEPQASEQDMSVIQAAGGLWSTTGDLYQLDRALKGDRLLSKEVHARMVAPRELSPTYACGWVVTPVHGRKCWHHSGGTNGYVADFLRFPDDDACVVVLSNHAFAPITRISADLGAILFGLEHAVPVALTKAQLDACTGVWTGGNPARPMLVRRTGNLLFLFEALPGNERCIGRLLIPTAPGRFLGPWATGELTIDGERVQTPSGDFARTARPDAGWRQLVGALRVDGTENGTGELAADGNRLVLRVPGTWPESIDVIALGDEAALTMYAEEFGTVVRRSGSTLRWTRNDGSVLVLTPAK